jgi:hypothetical protein
VVDELAAALEIQAEFGRLREDDCDRPADEGGDDEQDEE